MEVLSAVRSFFPINLKCGISMSLLVISVIHTNTTLKAPRVLLMGKNMLVLVVHNIVSIDMLLNKIGINGLKSIILSLWTSMNFNIPGSFDTKMISSLLLWTL